MKLVDLMAHISSVMPNATVDEDNYGQLIIYTDLKFQRDQTTGDETVVPFEEASN